MLQTNKKWPTILGVQLNTKALYQIRALPDDARPTTPKVIVCYRDIITLKLPGTFVLLVC